MLNFCKYRAKEHQDLIPKIETLHKTDLKTLDRIPFVPKPPVWTGNSTINSTPNYDSIISSVFPSSNLANHFNEQANNFRRGTYNLQYHSGNRRNFGSSILQNFDREIENKPYRTPQNSLNVYNPQVNPLELAQFVDKVQLYMKSLHYNFTGLQFYDINKQRAIKSLLEIAKDMIKFSLPIKCLEAVILGIYLTNPCPNQLVRFTLSFKSRCESTKSSHYHVLLGVYLHKLGYGCIGMSRKDTLMYKKLGEFNSLDKLIENIKESYEEVGHRLERVSFGLPVTHDSCSLESLDWSTVVITLGKNGDADQNSELMTKTERFSRLLRITMKE